jgi:hypothetical protein
MDDRILADQLAKTGNLMDLCFDDTWLNDTKADEDDGWIEAGVMMKPYVEYLKSLSPEDHLSLRFQAQLLMILLPELRQWLEGWGLGLSFEAVHLKARRILAGHLKRLTEEQAEWVDALIAEDNQNLPKAERKVRSQTVAMFSQLFTEEDWQTLAKVAAEGMSQGVLKLADKETVPPVALSA